MIRILAKKKRNHSKNNTFSSPNQDDVDDNISEKARLKYRLWEGRIREKLEEAKYEGDVDRMVPITLAELRTAVDPNGPGTKQAQLSDCLLQDVVSRCTGCSFDSWERLQNIPRYGPSAAHFLQPSGRPLGMCPHPTAPIFRPPPSPVQGGIATGCTRHFESIIRLSFICQCSNRTSKTSAR